MANHFFYSIFIYFFLVFYIIYEGDPKNPIVTSVPGESNERHDPDHLKPKYFNPDSVLQKSGHGSYVETSLGEV